MRALRSLDGAAFLGEGRVGDVTLPLPSLLWASPGGPGVAPSPSPGKVRLVPLEVRTPMERGIRVEDGAAALELRFGVPTPEVTGGEDPGFVLAPRVLGVHTPLSGAARERLSAEPWDLVVWSNGRSAFTRSEGFVREAVALREAAGPAPLLWAPRVATPGRLAFLTSLGIDLLDTTEGLWASSGPGWLYAEHDLLEEGPEDLPETGTEGSARSRRVRHVELEYAQELSRVRRAMRAGRLRELVESRLVPEPRRGELLRYFDRVGYDFQEQHAPVTGHGVRPYTTKEALRRPEAERFRRRFLERYRPSALKRHLLLLPCSRTKPYASSPTHRRFLRALEGVAGLPLVHVASVTSPLGVVPRELENVYPARHYDIPVTGEWDEDERRWVHDAVRRLKELGRYHGLVVHLPREEYGWLSHLLPEGEHLRWTVEGEDPSSRASLGSLRSATDEIVGSDPTALPPGGVLRIVREDLRGLARFQFSDALATALFEGEVRLSGRPWFQRLVSPAKEDLATWREENGLWRLTVAGARKVLDHAEGSRVELRGGVEIRGDLFAPGVLRGDPEIRIGDDVLLVRGGEVVGVGEARVPGPWMGSLPRGLAVKVRHRAHPDA